MQLVRTVLVASVSVFQSRLNCCSCSCCIQAKDFDQRLFSNKKDDSGFLQNLPGKMNLLLLRQSLSQTQILFEFKVFRVLLLKQGQRQIKADKNVNNSSLSLSHFCSDKKVYKVFCIKDKGKKIVKGLALGFFVV